MFLKKSITFLMSLSLAVAINSCKDDNEKKEVDEPVAVTGVSVSPTEKSIAIGESFTVTATVAPENAANQEVTWSSSDPLTAPVINGVVTGKKAGNATITVTTEDGKKTAECKVEVRPEPVISVESISFREDGEDEEIELNVGQTHQLTVYFNPTDAHNQTVTWADDDSGFATVDDNGLVTALAQGETVITATSDDGEHVATCLVTVSNKVFAVISISFRADGKDEEIELNVGDTRQLTVLFTPSNATNKVVTWADDGSGFATVDNNGLVTALAEGETVITATSDDGDFVATCYVTVIDNAIKPGDNLLVNPSFEDPDDSSFSEPDDAGTNSFQGWTRILGRDWINAYYPGNDNNVGNAAAGRQSINDPFFGESGIGYFFLSHVTGKYAGRVNNKAAGGVYQIVNVTPGKTYYISVDIGYRVTDDVEKIHDAGTQSVKILSPDGLEKIYAEIPIPTDPDQTEMITGASGFWTNDEGATEVRFSIDQRNPGGGSNAGLYPPSPLMVFDNCIFKEVVE